MLDKIMLVWNAVSRYGKAGAMMDAIPLVIVGVFLFYGVDVMRDIGGAYDNQMRNFFIILMRIMIAVVSVRVILRAFDHMLGFKYKEWFATADDRSKAIIVATRFFGVCFLLAACISI